MGWAFTGRNAIILHRAPGIKELLHMHIISSVGTWLEL